MKADAAKWLLSFKKPVGSKQDKGIETAREDRFFKICQEKKRSENSKKK